MRNGIASRTAWGVAIRRAAHQQLDHPTVFEDPFALRILGSGKGHPFEAQPIAGLPPTTGVVFDYSVPPDSLSPQARAAFDALAARVARAGEPFQLFLQTHQVASLLGKLGFHHVQDLGPAEIHQQYFATRADGLSVGPPGHLVAAWV